MNHLISRCPVAARRQHTFFEYVQVGGERRRADFTKEIVWLQKTEATSKYMHGGVELLARGTYVDSPTYLSSMLPSMHGVAQACKNYSIDVNSSLSLVIEVKVELVPVIEAEEDRVFNRSRLDDEYKKWTYPGFDWSGAGLLGTRNSENAVFHRRLGSIELGTQIVWSSQWSFEKNEAVMAKFQHDWANVVSTSRLEAALENAPGLALPKNDAAQFLELQS